MFLDDMPMMDGAEMHGTMAADPTLPAVPDVTISSVSEATVAERCAGYATFMRKPLKVWQLCRRHLDRHDGR